MARGYILNEGDAQRLREMNNDVGLWVVGLGEPEVVEILISANSR
jgi:hypothetical protein